MGNQHKPNEAAGAQASTEKEVTGHVLVVGPYLRQRTSKDGASDISREFAARLDEAAGLARAIDLEVQDSMLALLSQVRPATFLGKGKVAEVGERIKATKSEIVVMDCALSPVQQRNLEKEWNAKVLDRTGLILEIFGRRARTREGTLQVELAHLNYQRSRLVRSWTHLERQRGGFGFMGGPGETQIEADRRMISERIVKIETDLKKTRATRQLHREGRQRVPYRVVALVGYTNAGKSTLFNRLTQANVQSADMLFATLDPTLRALKLPHGGKAMLSDTVGFISDLPTMLVAAFRATLEEVVQADVIVHVRDISQPASDAEKHDVEAVLRQLDIDPADESRLIEVWNKIDKLDDIRREQLMNMANRQSDSQRAYPLSAETGEGIGTLLEAIETRLAAAKTTFNLIVDAADGAGVSWLHRNTEVIEKTLGEGHFAMSVRVDDTRLDEVARRFVDKDENE